MSGIVEFKIDSSIKHKKIEELLDIPVYVKVNHFNESGVKNFIDDFNKALNNSQHVVPILIDSYGGYVDSLLSMIDIIKSSSKPVATIVSGKAMSCGAILFSCGQEGMRWVAPNSRVMIHDVATGSHGKVEEIKADARETDRLNALVFKMMASNIGKPESYFLDLVHAHGHADWYLTAEECVKHNLANKIGLPKFYTNIKVESIFQ